MDEAELGLCMDMTEELTDEEKVVKRARLKNAIKSTYTRGELVRAPPLSAEVARAATPESCVLLMGCWSAQCAVMQREFFIS